MTLTIAGTRGTAKLPFAHTQPTGTSCGKLAFRVTVSEGAGKAAPYSSSISAM